MKHLTHKALALVLALAMTAGLLGGCGQSYDPIQEAFGYPGSTVMLKVDGSEVHASDLYYWLAYNADYIYQYYSILGGDGAINWDDTLGGSQSIRDYVKEEAQQTAVLYSAVLAHAAAKGYTFDSDDPAYAQELEAAKASLGGEEAFQRFLKEMCLTEESFEALNSVAVVYDNMREGLCRKGGEYEPTQEDLQVYAQENDLLAARHILLLTVDADSGEALSEEEIAQKREKAENLLGQLQAIEDPAQRSETFSKLMQENSEDSGLANYPDGYLFTAGDMVAEFENATRALEIGGMSEIVESDYGFHIIMRDDPTAAEGLPEQWSSAKMQSLTEEWVAAANVEVMPAFEELDVADFYEKLTAYRETLGADDEQAEDAQTAQDSQDAQNAEGADAQDAAGGGDAASQDAPQAEGQGDSAEGEGGGAAE